MSKTLHDRYEEELAMLYSMAVEQKNVGMALEILAIAKGIGETKKENENE